MGRVEEKEGRMEDGKGGSCLNQDLRDFRIFRMGCLSCDFCGLWDRE